MPSVRATRAVSFASVLLVALASSGCPELNRQPDHATDGQFNVDDPPEKCAQPEPPAAAAGILGPTRFMVSQQEGLPDQTRRAH
jgi:hypothetical protein